LEKAAAILLHINRSKAQSAVSEAALALNLET